MTKDYRLIIEKGGYRPETEGSSKPPATRPEPPHEGYRPTTDGPTTPPATKPPKGSGTKNE